MNTAELSAYATTGQMVLSGLAIVGAIYIGRKQNEISNRQLSIVETQNIFQKNIFMYENVYKKIQHCLKELLDHITDIPVNLNDFDESTGGRTIYKSINDMYFLYGQFSQEYDNKKHLLNKECVEYIDRVIGEINKLNEICGEMPSIKNSTMEDELYWENIFGEQQKLIYKSRGKFYDEFGKIFPN